MQAGPRLAAGWAMWVLCSGLLPGSTSSTEHTLRSNEEDVEGPVKPLDGTAALFDFFNPTTCRPKQGQTVIPCRAGMDLNKTECLHHKCCHSSWTQSQLKCYTPLKDRPQLTIRLFALGTGAMIILGCCPLCCCSLLQKSKCANPLQRPRKKVQIKLQKFDNSETIDELLENLLKKNKEKIKQGKISQ